MLLKVDCLPNAVGKQPSIPLIYLGRKWTLNWWWWWWWYFLMEPQKNLANEVFICGASPDDASESVATHSSRLQLSIICMPQLQPWCSAALVPKFARMKAQVSLETTIEPHDVILWTQPRASQLEGKYHPCFEIIPYLHICAISWHEVFIQVWTFLPHLVIRIISAATAANLNNKFTIL